MSCLLNTKQLREARGISIADLSRKSGIARGYLSELEKGRYDNPGLKAICNICKVLECTPNDLIPEYMYRGDVDGGKGT